MDYTAQLQLLPELLLPWYAVSKRDLPWRASPLPYHVWISEIMLQQTRVEAVKNYYARFLERFPDIPSLAAAEDDELLKLWEGLGYYNRARNLKKAAQLLCDEYGGEFPREYNAVRSLPGIGDYTAGAICSICFNQPEPAVDGNVLRVITRYTGYYGCTDDLKVRREITGWLRNCYPQEAGAFTQALMELGALVCVPNGAPRCSECPLKDCCTAKLQSLTEELPVRAEKKKRRQEQLTVFLFRCGSRIAVAKRGEHQLLAGLYELPNVPGSLSVEEAISQAAAWGTEPCELIKTVQRTHIFTHIQWNMTGIRIDCRQEAPQFQWADLQTISLQYALPTAFRQFLQDYEEESS